MARYLDKSDIERLINDIIKNNDIEIDNIIKGSMTGISEKACEEIKKLAIERVSYRKVLSILLNQFKGEGNNG